MYREYRTGVDTCIDIDATDDNNDTDSNKTEVSISYNMWIVLENEDIV